jgi:diaminopimelate epimerase
LIKAHAYGNDFLLLDQRALPTAVPRAALARAVCDRHRGLGGDGLIVYDEAVASGAVSLAVRMSLLNADGSYSEVSGNGLRCLAAWLAEERQLPAGAHVDVATDAGRKRLTLLERDGPSLLFRAAMGEPEEIRRVALDVEGTAVEAVTLRVGNPQCVVLGEVTPERLHSLAAKLAVHPHFERGTNVELAEVVSPQTVRILIWERGVGPTEASGTGACAAAVAAIAFGGASRDVMVVSPGGAQRVEWIGEGLLLTGSAEVVASCDWRRGVGGDA